MGCASAAIAGMVVRGVLLGRRHGPYLHMAGVIMRLR